MSKLWFLGALVALLVTPAYAGGDAPTISKNRGKKRGIIVLSTRVVPEKADPTVQDVADKLHLRLSAIAARSSVDEARIVTRPFPERVCPMDGCRALSLNAMIGHQEGGCFAVGLIGMPNGGQVQMVPWAGEVLASQRHVPFREPPETKIVVKEFVPCDELLSLMQDEKIERALAHALDEALNPVE